ncbi:type IV pilus assembly protein PilM [Candidatus Uhrbacteria bacterium]|nr:type IV pilus assembly protein PilM [Candidatus Uhrbacteria bacterium]
MALFGKKPQSYLGIDIGTSGIKLIEISREGGRPRLYTYAYTDRAPEELGVSLIDRLDETAALLKKMLKAAKARSVKAISGLPGSAVFSSVLSVPVLPAKELSAYIESQASKLIPMPITDVILDWKPYGPAAPEAPKANAPEAGRQKTTKVILTAAAKSMVKKYIDIFKKTGLELSSLETEAFALIRSLVGKDKSIIAIVDIGAVRTNVIIVENGVPVLSRSIALGGLNFTKTIGAMLQMDPSNAEQFKRDAKMLGTLFAEGQIPKTLEQVFIPIGNEVRYSFNLFAGQNETPKKVEKLILTGGSATLPQLAAFLTKLLGINAYIGDPFARTLFHEELRPVLNEIAPRFAVSAGLAMREFE